MATAELSILDLRCGACAEHIERELRSPAGVAPASSFPPYGIELRPEWLALLMSLSSIIVATNAVLLKRSERELAEPSIGSP